MYWQLTIYLTRRSSFLCLAESCLLTRTAYLACVILCHLASPEPFRSPVERAWFRRASNVRPLSAMRLPSAGSALVHYQARHPELHAPCRRLWPCNSRWLRTCESPRSSCRRNDRRLFRQSIIWAMIRRSSQRLSVAAARPLRLFGRRGLWSAVMFAVCFSVLVFM